MTNITHKAKVSGILKKLHELKESFFIIFKKKNGSKRLMHAKYGVKHDLKGGINYTQQSHFPYSTVWDITKQAYRTVNMDTVLAIITKDNKEYIFTHEEDKKADKILVPLQQTRSTKTEMLCNDATLR
tara:strand:+ start:1443 stop:1826 length:384 start_codon:yes stop_codon:yes gene_type:complete